MPANEKATSSNTAPLLAACTFLLGCLVAMVGMAQFGGVQAQEASPQSPDSSIKVSALSVADDSGREFLVVFKETKGSYGSLKGQNVTAMCVYSIFANGNEKASVNLVQSRMVDYDFRLNTFDPSKRSSFSVEDASEAVGDMDEQLAKEAERARKEAEEEAEREAKRNKDKKKDD